jgi:hypothetical protein
MRKEENNRSERRGISIPVSVMVIAVVSVIIASTAVIVNEGIERAREDDNVLHPYFHLYANPSHQNSTIGEWVTYEINLVPHIYLYAPCRLVVLDMYDGVYSSITPNVIYPGDVATLTVKGTIVGEFFREVVGTYNGQKDAVRVTIDVRSDEDTQNTGSFRMVAEPWIQTTSINVPAYYEISLETGDDFQGEVELEVLDCYDGVLSVLKPESIGANETAVLILTPLCPGEFTRSITGTNDDFEICIMVALTVKDRNSYEDRDLT